MAVPAFVLKGKGSTLHGGAQLTRDPLAGFTATITSNAGKSLLSVDGQASGIDQISVDFDADGWLGGPDGIELPADDASLNLERPLAYHISISGTLDYQKRTFDSFWFAAAEDGEILSLNAVTRVGHYSATGSLVGRQGPRSKLVKIADGPPKLYRWQDEYGNFFGASQEFDIVPFDLDDIDDVTPIGKILGTAPNKAVGRAAVDAVTIVNWTGSAWPIRPADPGPVIFVGGIAPGNEPPGLAGDVWIPTVEDGTVAAAWDAITGKPDMPKNNYIATTNPTVSSDAAGGYAVGSHWVNTATNVLFECVKATTGAAVWQRLTADVQLFSASGTWTKPVWAQTTQVILCGAGAGGGSGRRGATATASSGGGGGGGGGFHQITLPTSSLGGTETVTVGVGGSGGAAVATDSTSGNAGGSGGGSSFGTKVRTAASAGGAAGISGGGATGGAGGGGFATGNTGGSGVSGAAGAVGGNSVQAGPGGGGGGGCTAATAFTAGGVGGTSTCYGGSMAGGAGGATDAANGTAGSTAAVTGLVSPGSGGGGGASSVIGVAGSGGSGGVYGAGGGGGGASINGSNSGAGGSGANGIVIVISR